jgi:hypothetical protein
MKISGMKVQGKCISCKIAPDLLSFLLFICSFVLLFFSAILILQDVGAPSSSRWTVRIESVSVGSVYLCQHPISARWRKPARPTAADEKSGVMVKVGYFMRVALINIDNIHQVIVRMIFDLGLMLCNYACARNRIMG